MIYQILLFYILLIFHTWRAQCEPEKCREGITKKLPPHQLLRQDLFCLYDKESRPINDFHEKTMIGIKLYINFFTLDEYKNVLDIHAWLMIHWIDFSLNWNPVNYSGIDTLSVKSYDIRQPDLTIQNSENMETNGAWDFTHCVLYSAGFVLCAPSIKLSAQCSANLRQWPFDQHICNVIIGSQSQTKEEVDFSLVEGGIDLGNFTSNREWELLNSSASTMTVNLSTSSYPFMKFSFHIKRHADAYAATVVIPSLALTLMTLASYWLDPKKSNRLSVCCVSTLCHCLYLQYLGLKLPVNGSMTPIIILLYRDSLIITIIALVLAVAAERLPSSKNVTSDKSLLIPAWLERFIGVVSYQKADQLLQLAKFELKGEDGASLMENGPQSKEGKGNQEWYILFSIIDRLGFLISLITYLILYVALIPNY